MRRILLGWAFVLLTLAAPAIAEVDVMVDGELTAALESSIVVTTPKGKYIVPKGAVRPHEVHQIEPAKIGKRVYLTLPLAALKARKPPNPRPPGEKTSFD